MRVAVTFIPLGDMIKYRLRGRVYCRRQRTYIPNSQTYTKDDGVYIRIFKGKRNVRQFLHKNKPVTKVIELMDLGYDECDLIR